MHKIFKRDDGYADGDMFYIFVLICVVIAGIVWLSWYIGGDFTETITVTNRYEKNSGNKGRFFVVDEGNNVYIVRDNWLRGQTRSADTYAQLRVGGTYEVSGHGWRFGLFSWFQNILEVEEISPPPSEFDAD